MAKEITVIKANFPYQRLVDTIQDIIDYLKEQAA